MDLGSISLRDEQSAERPVPTSAGKKSPLLAVLIATVVLGAVGTIVVMKVLRPGETKSPEPIADVTSAPEPVKPEPEPVKPEPEPVKPEPVAVAVKVDPEPVKPEPEPVKPEPIAAVTPPKPIKTKPKVKPQPAVAVAKAGVEFRVRPFGAVWVDGAYLGETPFAPAQLSVGAHSVRVVNRDLGKEVTKQFDVKDGSNVFRHNFEE